MGLDYKQQAAPVSKPLRFYEPVSASPVPEAPRDYRCHELRILVPVLKKPDTTNDLPKAQPVQPGSTPHPATSTHIAGSKTNNQPDSLRRPGLQARTHKAVATTEDLKRASVPLIPEVIMANSSVRTATRETTFFFVCVCVYLFLRERERQRGQRRGRERGRHRIPSRLQALICQHRARCGARTHEPRDHDLSRSRTLNRLSHPGAPPPLFVPLLSQSHVESVIEGSCLGTFLAGLLTLLGLSSVHFSLEVENSLDL